MVSVIAFQTFLLKLGTIVKMNDLMACDGHLKDAGNVLSAPEIEQPYGILVADDTALVTNACELICRKSAL